ncbi:protein of unknown function [Rhodovastum atsumiense]|uniref:hypothetical protein n=1 Tax=Rhodovastum atsumiense TaxID=504468 RepID=UPI00139F2C97|nr:hypothetical protein [Rhodovastum atsumiense]CAH2604558.1 protein of unknown function [Rhodovastum atsumiense]
MTINQKLSPMAQDLAEAARFRQLARDAGDPWIRALLLDLAETYEDAAHDREAPNGAA